MTDENTPAMTEENTPDITVESPVAISASQNPWARISEVAARLGVHPIRFTSSPTMVATGADGNTYDIWEVVLAFIDHMDRKSR